MSPTIFVKHGLRFYFFSREEPRVHVHVGSDRGKANFWLDPVVELADNSGMSSASLRTARALIREHEDEIRSAWKAHFER